MIAVVIPAYNAASTIVRVIKRIGPEIDFIIVVDDCCPESTSKVVQTNCPDPRVTVIVHDVNQGVGGAFLTGMRAAIERRAQIIIKVDADGQMDPQLIPALIAPIENAQADFVKGNRFFFFSNARSMPGVRLFGNLTLSFLTKLSSGYWNIMDPTNGFFAIQGDVAALLVTDRVAKRFFFETDLLFHLGLLRAKVVEFPMEARYGDETSNLKASRVVSEFIFGHLRNAFRRILYKYFIRDFSVASVELVFGALLLLFGLTFGTYHWFLAAISGEPTPTGTIMIATISLLFGFQLLLAFLNYDISSVPREPLHPFLVKRSSGNSLSVQDKSAGARSPS
jgi:glycosyltransferase involved in cell wall biosynthesis